MYLWWMIPDGYQNDDGHAINVDRKQDIAHDILRQASRGGTWS